MRSTSASKVKKTDLETTKATDSSQIQDPSLDPVLKQKIQQLMDMTHCTQDNAIFALHDSDNDVNAAVNMLLESGNDMQGGWQEQKTKSKKKQTTTTQASGEPDGDFAASADSDGDVRKESRSTERSYPRNAPPRMQRGGRRPEYRSRDDGRDGLSSERRSGGERGRGRGRGRGRSGSNRSEGGFNRGGESGFGRAGGFGRSGGDNHSGGDQGDLSSGPQIGTWTSEADANPKTDSWGDVWTEDDNQWQGDLKGTHVFESSAKTDTFPTPTNFDPSAAAALPTAPSAQPPQATLNINGTVQQPSVIMDSFPKQQVETLSPPSISLYDNQLASDSIKSAIGMPTQQQQRQQAEEASKNSAGGLQQQSAPSQVPNSGVGQPSAVGQSVGGLPQRQNRQQRSKLPPPSTKIPTAPVEMPHIPSSSIMNQLGVQFGTMDFTSDTSNLPFETSSMNSGGVVGGYTTTSPVISGSSSLQQMNQQQSMPTSLYGSSNVSHGAQQTGGGGPEPILFPNSNAQQSNSQALPSQQNSQSQQLARQQGQQSSNSSGSSLYHSSQSSKSAPMSQHHSGYTPGSVGSSSQYKQSQQPSHSSSQQQSHHAAASQPSSADSHPAQSFQNTRASATSSSGGGFYPLPQNLQDGRVTSSTYQSTAQPSSITPSAHTQQSVTGPTPHSHQYTNSLYSSQNEQHTGSYGSHHYNVGVTSAAALSGSSTTPVIASSHVAPLASQSQQLASSRASKAPPNLPPPAATATVPVAMPNYIMNPPGVPYYNQQQYYNAATSMEELQKYQQLANPGAYYDLAQFPMSTSTFPGATGAGDGKMARLDAQSPTVQGSQANQSQQQATSTNTQSHQQQQQYMSLPPGYAGYAYYPGATTVLSSPYPGMYQVPSVTQSLPGTSAAVYSNQKAGGNVTAGSNYYPGTTNNYDDSMQSGHSSAAEYGKNVYTVGKQTNNLTGVSGSSTEMQSMFPSAAKNSQTNAAVAAATIYGANPSAYMSAHAAATGHLIPNQQHLIQSQLGGPVAQDSSRGSQAKSHSKQNYYGGGGGGGGWGN